MSNPKNQRPGNPHLERDRQQWIYDYIVQQSGRASHWWPAGERDLPKEVRSHAMIAKHLGREGQRLEAESDLKSAAGDQEEALKLAVRASLKFMRAQHTIFSLNDEKRFLYAGLQRCYDKVIERCSYRIERIDIPWEDTSLSGYLHLCPGKDVAPLVFHIPGCDQTSEICPDPIRNPLHDRGMHVFSMDGPGLGRSNMRGIRLSPDNYERAVSTAVDYLVQRPEIDADNIVIYTMGLGSFWGLRSVAFDHRFKAIATRNTYADLYYLMNEEGPRWKRLFAFLTQARTEEELDLQLDEMTLDGYIEQIVCPTLMVSGEYDLRDPIDDVFGVFDRLQAPAELWVYADQMNVINVDDGSPSPRDLSFDWLADRVRDEPMTRAGEVMYVEPGGSDPASPDVEHKRRWYETAR